MTGPLALYCGEEPSDAAKKARAYLNATCFALVDGRLLTWNTHGAWTPSRDVEGRVNIGTEYVDERSADLNPIIVRAFMQCDVVEGESLHVGWMQKPAGS
jgi:hypothetical protein